MTKVDIISGFLGAGKTTLIKKLLAEAFPGRKIVLIENEFGEIGIDGGFLREAGIQITEMNSGCICCSLVGDFGRALKEVLEKYAPDRIIIEPSGVGKLSDVEAAVLRARNEGCELEIGCLVTVADANKCKMYIKNFGEFYNNQVEAARTIVLSRTDNMSEEKLAAAIELLRGKNPTAPIITTPWPEIGGAQILEVMESSPSVTKMADELREALEHDDDDDEDECCCGHHHHHHDDDDEECGCHHHHHHDDDDDEECECHHHHHHDDDDDEECGCHHHHHHHDDDDDEECGCHHHHHHHDDADEDECCCGHHHHHHHGHDADEVFTSWGVETAKKFEKSLIEAILDELKDSTEFGIVLRAKGIIPLTDGTWAHFDLVPGEAEIRSGAADYTGRLCVIGSKINEEKLTELFGL